MQKEKIKTKTAHYPYEAVDEFWNDIFHDDNYDGIIFLCGKTKDEKFFTIRKLSRNELGDYLKTLEILPYVDYYFTPNQFKKKKGGATRRSDNFFASTCTIIDIDIHDKRMSQDCIEKMLLAYKAKLDTLIALEEAFPYHYCIHTGRGLQFVYIYEKAINYKLLIMHKRMQELILRQHSLLLVDNPELQIKLDKGATQKLSGVFRIPMTYNTKVHKYVDYSKTYYPFLDCSKIIDSYGFIDNTLNTNHVSSYHIKEKYKKSSNNHKTHYSNLINAIYKYQEEHYAYRQNPGHENRNCTCFVLIHLLLVTMDYNDALHEILSFNQNFYMPLPEKRLISMLDYAYENYLDDKKYKMRFLKTSTILEMLNLENGEYGIYDNSALRKKTDIERATNRENRKHRDDQICSLYKQNMEYKEIAQEVNCSVRTVQRIVLNNFPSKNIRKNKSKKVIKLYLQGMPYNEISQKTSISVRGINKILKDTYPQGNKPKPWDETGISKKEYYKKHKRPHS